jgi:AcrR family transcriptional regulator
LQHLSLSAIEKRAGMSRGQLTYYFPAKEDILLAVFDRLLVLIRQRVHGEDGLGDPCSSQFQGWERICHLLSVLLLQPAAPAEFQALQYTFLSEIGHREDFRLRLANLYEEWRREMTRDLEEEFVKRDITPKASPRTIATLVQAILHGLFMQRSADPDSYDRDEMLELCVDVIGSFLNLPVDANANGRPAKTKRATKKPRVKA